MADIEVNHLALGDGFVEVGYSEPERDVGDGVARLRTLVVDRDAVEEELSDVVDTIQELVDRCLSLLNPSPTTRPARGSDDEA